jgi:hypothetical protein
MTTLEYRAAASSGRLGELVEGATVAFDDAVSNLFQVDILQNDGTAVSTFESEGTAGTDRLSACDH